MQMSLISTCNLLIEVSAMMGHTCSSLHLIPVLIASLVLEWNDVEINGLLILINWWFV